MTLVSPTPSRTSSPFYPYIDPSINQYLTLTGHRCNSCYGLFLEAGRKAPSSLENPSFVAEVLVRATGECGINVMDRMAIYSLIDFQRQITFALKGRISSVVFEGDNLSLEVFKRALQQIEDDAKSQRSFMVAAYEMQGHQPQFCLIGGKMEEQVLLLDHRKEPHWIGVDELFSKMKETGLGYLSVTMPQDNLRIVLL